MFDKQYGVGSVWKSAWLAALVSLPMWLAAGCGVDPVEDDQDTASETQEVLSGCHILRPYGWHRLGVNCVDDGGSAPLDLAPGQSFTFFSSGNGVIGSGRITVVCHSNGDGRWDEINRSCRRSGVEP
jgi:hypothetical protein